MAVRFGVSRVCAALAPALLALAACQAAPASSGASSGASPGAAAVGAGAARLSAAPAATGTGTPALASTAPTGAGIPVDSASQARYAAAPRLVAIGDVHGDWAAARQAFALGGATDANGHWVGGSLTVVQTGDQLDRGDEERALLDWLDQVQAEAVASGGRVVVLNGNHETMNVAGDFRYVTSEGFRAFAGASPPSSYAAGIVGQAASRAQAFLPGGAYALRLAKRPLVAIVGDTAFAHGGILPEHVAYGIDRLNAEVGAWMRGERPAVPAAMSEEAPVWTRVYGGPALEPSVCETLGKVLRSLGVARLVVGHTTQPGGITAACGDRVHRIDVGLARAYGGPIQVLEISAGVVRILSQSRRAPG